MLLSKFQSLKHYAGALIGLIVFVLAGLAIRHILADTHLAAVLEQFRAMPKSAVFIAILCTAGSYFALTIYDVLALRHIGKPLPYGTAALASFAGCAISHNVGVSLLTGGSVRHRIYAAAGLSAGETAQVTAFCATIFGISVTFLLGLTLAIDPGLAGAVDHLPLGVNRAGGCVLLALIVAYLVWIAIKERTVQIKSWQLRAPRLGVTLLQFVAGAADIVLAAGTLYVFLPTELSVNFIGFVGVFIIAVTIGVLSHAPGGIGVFEAVILLSYPHGDHSALLGALLAYRVIYYFVPFAIASSLLALNEFRARKGMELIASSRPARAAHAIAPQIIGSAVFLGGAVLLLSGSTPVLSDRAELLRDFLPLPFVEASHFFASIVGFALLILSRGLFRRLDGARHLTMGLLIAGIIFSVAKGIDYEEATILAVVAALLYLSRSAFYRRASMLRQRYSPTWIITILIVVLASIWLGAFSYKHVEYSNQLWWTLSYQEDAPSFLRAAVAVAALALGFLLYLLLRPVPSLPSVGEQGDTAKALNASLRADGNLAWTGDKQMLFSADGSAFLMFQIQGRSWVVMGDPVGPEDAWGSLLWRFREICDRHNGWPALYQISTECLPHALDMGLSLVKLGEEAQVDLESFTLEGSRNSSLRQANRKAEREGASFEVIPAANVRSIMADLSAVSESWLGDKTAHEKGFSIGKFDPAYLEKFDCAVVRSAGVIVAFANIWRAPAGKEISIDLMRYSEDAPRGVMDYLFIQLLLLGKAEGYERFSLGMAPLSGIEAHPLGPAWNRLGAMIFEHGERYYNFEGLRAYKEKFHPDWEPRYLAAPGGLALPRILIDITALIAGGMQRVFSK